MVDIVETIRNYVRQENPIWDKEEYDEMLNAWPNQKEVTLYRGINFKTKDSYEDFLRKFDNDGGYLQQSASSFSADFLTAQGFAKISKSYFLDLETMKANSTQNVLGERISGYRGVILKITVPPHSVVDVQASGEAIENEYLFRPGEKLNVEIQELKTFYDLTQDEGFDVNKALEIEIVKEQNKKESILNNNFANYLIINHIDEINDSNKLLICQNDLSLELKRRRNIKASDIDDESRYLIDNNEFVSAVYYKGQRYRGEYVDEINIQALDFTVYEEKGLVTPEIKSILRKAASEALQMAMEVHLEYRDQEKLEIKYDGLSCIYDYLSKDEMDLHQRMIGYKAKEKYEDINKKIGESFTKKGARGSRNEMTAMTDFLNSLINSLPAKGLQDKNKKERQKRVEDAKQHRQQMLGIESEEKTNKLRFK